MAREPHERPLPEQLVRDLRRSAKAGPDAASRARIEAAVRARTGGGGGGSSRLARPGAGTLALVAASLVAVVVYVVWPRDQTSPPVAVVSGAPVSPAPTPSVVDEEREEAPEADEPEVVAEAVTEVARPAREAIPSEVELLDAAHASLGASPGRALAYLDRHATLYPEGIFAEEREALAVEALLRLGRASRAASRRARFDASYPSSPHRARLDEVLRTTESTEGP